MRLAKCECSRPNGRRVTAKTRPKSDDSSRTSRARPQHKSTVARRQGSRKVSINCSMRLLLITLAVLAAGSIAVAVTDADRVQVYHDFRAAFDARRYQDALPLAEKLVSMTQEQYGATDRALVNPLSNLGTTQYRLKDYK